MTEEARCKLSRDVGGGASGVRSRQRVIDHGEVLTPPELVNQMLDLVAWECKRIDSRFLEPACGDGNFLAEVFRRKLETVMESRGRDQARWEFDAVVSVCSLYGIDLLPDNVAACRERLLMVVDEAYLSQFKQPLPEPVRRVVEFVLTTNIVHGDALSLKAADGLPIIFADWSAMTGMMLKRRDYSFGELLGHGAIMSTPLFSDLGRDVFVPKPVSDYPACHYLGVPDARAKSR